MSVLSASEHYMPQPSSSSSSAAASSSAAEGRGGGSGLYLDAYEVSFPLEESIERPPAYHLNQGPQMMDGTPHPLLVYLLCYVGVNVWSEIGACSSSSPCRASSLSVQPLHHGVEPARSPVRLSGEERLAAEAHRGAGGREELPALPAGPLHRQHEGPGG